MAFAPRRAISRVTSRRIHDPAVKARLAAVTPDMNIFGQGYMFGNYDYLDKARLLSDRGKTGQFRVKVSDPSKTAETLTPFFLKNSASLFTKVLSE